MNVKEKLKETLVSRGMFPEQADEVLKQAIPVLDRLDPNYVITWDAKSDEYPDSVYKTWMVSLKREALKWIDKNLPLAWYRPMFERDPIAYWNKNYICNKKMENQK